MPVIILFLLLIEGGYNQFLPPTPPLHISHLSILQYVARDTSDLYVFLSVQLSKSPGILVKRAVIGFSPDKCHNIILARATLHIGSSQADSDTVTVPVMVHLDRRHQVLGRVMDTCLRSHYSTREGEVFTGWRLQQHQFTFPLVYKGDTFYQNKQTEENTFQLEIGGLVTGKVPTLISEDLHWEEGQSVICNILCN